MQIEKEIQINEIRGFRIGNAENADAGTGCTVILPEHGAVTGIDVRGGGPASRESALLNPLAANDSVNAVLLSGGSAFGLDAASGVMQYLEERKEGFPTGEGVVPIVCASCLYDLEFIQSSIRPDAAMGYKACMNAGNYQDGCLGAGCGATVGKILGSAHMMKSGIGSCALQLGNLQIGAIAAVNAAGSVYDPYTGEFLAGILDENNEPIDAEEAMLSLSEQNPDLFRVHTNTTLGAIITNGSFNKTQLTKIAGMAHDGFARAIRPVHTMYDGDSIYALSNGTVQTDLSAAGTLAAKAMALAVKHAVLHAWSAGGLKCAGDLR